MWTRRQVPFLLHGLLLLWRVATVVLGATRAQFSIPLNGIPAGSAYTMSVAIGTVSGVNNTFRLIADTGSSNDAVLGSECCAAVAQATYSCEASSSCREKSAEPTKLVFAGASISGHYVTDTWSSSAFPDLPKRFLVVEEETSFLRSDYDGITGLAYPSIARPQPNPPPSFYDDIVKAGGTTDAFGMLLCGILQPLLLRESKLTYHAGQWLIGGLYGINGEQFFTGDMFYSPIVKEAWYVVTVSDMGFDGKSLGLPCVEYNDPQAIVDSGTTNLAFPPEVYSALVGQIRQATLAKIPDFNTELFDASKTCCGLDYCDPSNAKSPLLELPSIYVSFALQSDDSLASTSQHYTVEIPPAYYWRPEMNGRNHDKPCRAFGISEGSSLVLGDVFMDGLYTYHDRANSKIGIALGDNCPNKAVSSKKVYAASDLDVDWCECLSSKQQSSSLISAAWPWSRGCFYWLWWKIIVLVSVLIVLLCVGILTYWKLRARQREKIGQHQRSARAISVARTNPSSSDLVQPPPLPSAQSQPGRATPGPGNAPSTSSPSQRPNESSYAIMSSPQSATSDTSSIALLSASRASPVNEAPTTSLRPVVTRQSSSLSTHSETL